MTIVTDDGSCMVERAFGRQWLVVAGVWVSVERCS